MKYPELEQYKTKKELEKFTENLLDRHVSVKAELDALKDKLQHFEAIEKDTKSAVSIGSNEEELCKLEIRRLYDAAKNSPLEFNEVKAFEIYAKTLLAIKGKSLDGDPNAKKSKEPKFKDEDLMRFAQQVQAEDDPTEQ
jgi:hypothetical protein